MKKVSFIFLCRIIFSVSSIFLSLLCFPIVFDLITSDLSGIIWVVLSCLLLVFSVLSIIVESKKESKGYYIAQMVFSMILIAISWMEEIFMQYDTSPLFYIFAVSALAISIILSVFGFKSSRGTLQNH